MVKTESQQIRLLVVDDDENDFIFVKRLLEASTAVKYKAEWAPDMETARERLAHQEVEAVLVDYRMGRSNGLDLLRDRWVMQERPPIILLTGRDDLEVDQEAMEAGASDYLCKTSLSARQLDRVIRYTVRDHQAQKMARQSSRLLDGLTSHLPLSVVWLDDKGVLRDWRGIKLPSFGMPLQQMGDVPLGKIVPGFKKAIQDAQEGSVVPLEWISHEGETTSVFEVTFLPDSGGAGGVIGFMMDVTEKARAESRVKRQSDLLASMAENLPIMIGRLDQEGKIREIQGMGLKRLKIKPHRIIGLDPSPFYPLWHDRLSQLRKSEMISFAVGGHTAEDAWNFEVYLFKENPPLQGTLFFALDLTGQRDVERKVRRDGIRAPTHRYGFARRTGSAAHRNIVFGPSLGGEA